MPVGDLLQCNRTIMVVDRWSVTYMWPEFVVDMRLKKHESCRDCTWCWYVVFGNWLVSVTGFRGDRWQPVVTPMLKYKYVYVLHVIHVVPSQAGSICKEVHDLHLPNVLIAKCKWYAWSIMCCQYHVEIF